MNPQTAQALSIAQETRLYRADLRARIRDMSREGGRDLVAECVEKPDTFLLTLRVWDLLGWPRRHGPGTVQRLVLSAGVGSYMQVGRLTDRQRMELAKLLRGQE